MFELLLRSQGWDVRTAGGGEEAWSLVASGAEFDAVVTDFLMPVMDGGKLVERIAANPRTARIPVVVITALPEDDPRLDAVRRMPKCAVLAKTDAVAAGALMSSIDRFSTHI